MSKVLILAYQMLDFFSLTLPFNTRYRLGAFMDSRKTIGTRYPVLRNHYPSFKQLKPDSQFLNVQ